MFSSSWTVWHVVWSTTLRSRFSCILDIHYVMFSRLLYITRMLPTVRVLFSFVVVWYGTDRFYTSQGYVTETFNCHINTLRPRQNGRHFADDIFRRIFLNEDVWIQLKISLKFVPKGPINNIPTLVQVMAWRRPGDKPLSEPMMFSLSTHICVTLPQWVNSTCNIPGDNDSLYCLYYYQLTCKVLINNVSKVLTWRC